MSSSAAAPPPPDPSTLSDDELVLELQILTAHIDAAKARWLLLVAEVRARGLWAAHGARSCAEWVAWQCGIGAGAAREQVRVAGALQELPAVAEAFGRGELSYSKVRALTRLDELEDGPELVDLGRAHTASQLDRVVRATRRVDRAEAAAAHVERAFTLHDREDGGVDLRGRLGADEAAVLRRALEAAEQVLRERADDDPASGPRAGETMAPSEPGTTAAARRADALLLLADTVLGVGPRPRSAPRRHEVVVHVDSALLSPDASAEASAAPVTGAATTDDGAALAAEVARRLCCDAGLVTSLDGPDGTPLSIGRRRRTVPASIRRALERRDGGCQFPGCGARRWVDAHHVEHWVDGGETSLDNLVLLCHHHHKLLHEGGYRGSWTDDGPGGRRFAVENEHGVRLPPVVAARAGHASVLRRTSAPDGRPIDPRATAGRQTGQRLDLGLSVAALLRRLRGNARRGSD